MGLIITLLKPLVWAACRILFRIEFQGADNIPSTGACLITPNHFTYLDPIWITIPIKRRVYYMAWDKPFKIPVLGQMMRIFGAFPVRLEAAPDASAQRKSTDLLSQDRALIIFPEGGRSHTPNVTPFKLGAFRLALVHGAPIVPVTISGGYEIWPTGKILPRFGKVRVIFHPRIPVERVADETTNVELKRLARSLALEAHTIVANALDPSPITVDSSPASR